MGLDFKKLKERMDKPSGNGSTIELQVGDNVLRLVPPSLEYLAGDIDYFAFEYKIHYGIGAPGSEHSEVCLRTLGKETKCPICEAVAMLYRTKHVEDETLGKKLYARRRYLFNVIDLNATDRGIQVMDTGSTIYEEVYKFIIHPDWGDLLDLDVGRNVTITKVAADKSGTGYVAYHVTPSPNKTSTRSEKSELENYLPVNYKEAIGKLKSCIPVPKSYDILKDILEGGGNTSTVNMSAVRSSISTGAAPVAETVNQESEPSTEHKKPAPVETKHTSSAPQAKTPETPKAPVVPEAPKASATPMGNHPLPLVDKGGQMVPFCYGEKYGPKRDVCIPCSYKVPCRAKFLEA